MLHTGLILDKQSITFYCNFSVSITECLGMYGTLMLNKQVADL